MNLKEKIKECLPEKKEIGFEEGQEKPTFNDEVWAEAYETKAEAWFAGWDNCIDDVHSSIDDIIEVIRSEIIKLKHYQPTDDTELPGAIYIRLNEIKELFK